MPEGKSPSEGRQERGSREPTKNLEDYVANLPEAVREELRLGHSDDAEKEAKASWRAFVDANKGKPPLERAERWLKYACDSSVHNSEEPLVYLMSRGHDCSAQVSKLREHWKDLERGATQGWQERAAVFGYSGRSPADIDSDIVPNFWSGLDYQGLHILATMLRAADWCRIGGFEDWWRRTARELGEEVCRGGVESGVRGSYLVANLARADMAYDLMPKVMERVLEAVEVPIRPGLEGPWQQFPDRPKIATHYGHAANIAIASALVRGEVGALANRACEVLMRDQNKEGWWPAWSTDPEGSIDETARGVHALYLCRPHGWERAVDSAAQWLLGVQTDVGMWYESGMPDCMFLTVLVLDALALASGSPRMLTFRRSLTTPRQQDDDRKSRRFAVGLTFPGESRGLVGSIARILKSKLGVDRILYDRFHEAEFARHDLDTYLERLYREECELVVVFLGSDYQRKEWCGVEWRAVRDLRKQGQKDRVMLLKLDSGPVDGLLSIDGYIDIGKSSAQDVAALIMKRWTS